MKIFTWIKERLSEKGTRSVVIGAIVFVAARLGLELDAETQIQIDGLIVAITAFVVSVLKEKTVED